jgi:CPA2 family monovalent cation:H+ antiporter-2
MIINAVIVAAIFLGISQVAHLANSAGLILALFLSAPFFWAMVMSHAKIKQGPKLTIQYTEKKTNRVAAIAFEVFRWLAGVLLLSLLSTKFIELKFAIAVIVASGMILLFIFSRQLEKLYARLESRFVKNFSNQTEAPASSSLPALAPWEAHLEALEVDPSAEMVGKTLEQLNIREKYGITIALIERGHKKIPAPNGSEMILPYDKVYVIGTDEEIVRFKNMIIVETEYKESLLHFCVTKMRLMNI